MPTHCSIVAESSVDTSPGNNANLYVHPPIRANAPRDLGGYRTKVDEIFIRRREIIGGVNAIILVAIFPINVINEPQGLKIVWDASRSSPFLHLLPFLLSLSHPLASLFPFPRGQTLSSLTEQVAFARSNSSVGTQKGVFRPRRTCIVRGRPCFRRVPLDRRFR